MVTRTGQKTNGHLLTECEYYVQQIMSKFVVKGVYYGMKREMVVNKDEAADFFKARPNSTVHYDDENTISVQFSWSNTRLLTA